VVEIFDQAGGGTRGDEAAGAVEEVLLVGPDGARAEACDLHTLPGLDIDATVATQEPRPRTLPAC